MFEDEKWVNPVLSPEQVSILYQDLIKLLNVGQTGSS
jgi:hypothetical protein